MPVCRDREFDHYHIVGTNIGRLAAEGRIAETAGPVVGRQMSGTGPGQIFAGVVVMFRQERTDRCVPANANLHQANL